MSTPRSALTRTIIIGAVMAVALLSIPAPASAAKVTHLRDFIGAWQDPAGGPDLVKVAKDGPRITVRLWSSCSDERCYLGEFSARRFATPVADGSRGTVALTGQRVLSFATVTYTLTLRDGSLVMQQTTTFTDGSGRQDYYVELVLSER